MSEDPFTRFLTDMKAEHRSATFEQMTEWVKAQGELQKFFSELKESKFIIQENLDERCDFDFLIRKGGDEIIGILQHKTDDFILSLEKLEKLNSILSNNAQSQAILYIWIIPPAFPSITLSPETFNRLLKRNRRPNYDFSRDIKPLRQSVKTFFKDYEGILFSIPRTERGFTQQAKNIMLSDTFNDVLLKKFGELKNKRYKNEYRIKAAQALTQQDLDNLKTIFDLSLKKKLDESAIKYLLSEISKVSKK